MASLIGKAFGPYKVLDKIGEGGMAVVYRGVQESLDRYVAIKVLRTELSADQQFIARFRQEALAVAQLSHPNILHVYDAGFAHGVYYLVMAYVDGGSLQDLIAQGPVEPAFACSIAVPLAEALDHAHQRGLVHRDVKPSNILLTRDGRPLLTDFGIARLLDEGQRLTRTGTSIGTPEYMAPEQAQGQQTDGRTDIYALGIVLYEILAGTVPFSAQTPVATLYRHVNEPAPPLQQLNISVPDWLGAVVAKALAKRPVDRFQRAGELAEALRQGREPAAVGARIPSRQRGKAAATQMMGAATAERAAPARRRLNLVPVLMAILGVALVAAAAVGAASLFGGGSDGDGDTAVSPTVTLANRDEETQPPAGATTSVPAAATISTAATPSPTATLSPTASPTPTVTRERTETPTRTPSRTPTPTRTPSRTPSRTPTTAPSTDTPVPLPTNTQPPPPTNTPVPPTNTPKPPTNTPAPPPPTNTPAPPPPTATQPPPSPTTGPPPPP
jgi:serine/threonine protein kinase